MAEPNKQQMGDGRDNFGGAANNMRKAGKQLGKNTAKKVAAKSVEATTNAAANNVNAAVKAGKAVATIAKGTAAGGPWGAIIAAAWSLRHTLFKILVCICLAVLFVIVVVVALPSIMWDNFWNGGDNTTTEGLSFDATYMQMVWSISEVTNEGHAISMEKVEETISNKGYDYDLSMSSLNDQSLENEGYDVCYILAAYSASMMQQNTVETDMISKLRSVAGSMYPVSYVENNMERVIPASYQSYRPVTVTVVTGVVNDTYQTESRTFYVPSDIKTTMQDIEITTYKTVTVTVPLISEGEIVGTEDVTYYEPNGVESIEPETEIVKYAEFTIHAFDNSIVNSAFSIDPDLSYSGTNYTYGEVIQYLTDALKLTLYGGE